MFFFFPYLIHPLEAWLLQKGFPAFTKNRFPSRFFLHSVQLKHWEWQLLLRASTHRSPASMGNPQFMHFVVNNSFQSSSQQGRPSSKQKGELAKIFPQYAQAKHSGWKVLPIAFKQFCQFILSSQEFVVIAKVPFQNSCLLYSHFVRPSCGRLYGRMQQKQ